MREEPQEVNTRSRRARPILAAKRVWGWTSQRASANQLQAARPCRLLCRPKRPSITSAIPTTDRNSWCKSPGSLKSTPCARHDHRVAAPNLLTTTHPSIVLAFVVPQTDGNTHGTRHTGTQGPRTKDRQGAKGSWEPRGSGVGGPVKQAWAGYQSVPGVGGRPSEGRKKFIALLPINTERARAPRV